MEGGAEPIGLNHHAWWSSGSLEAG
jgi:hypothetical protein